MMKVAVFLTTFCFIATYGEPVLQNSLFLTEHESYMISSVQLTYLQAYATCKSYGYTLAVERSAEDTAALNAAITATGDTSYMYYIGGFKNTDGVFKSAWIWIETGDPIDYSNWYNNTQHVHSYDCLTKQDLASHNLTWLSTSCSTEQYFICQKNVN